MTEEELKKLLLNPSYIIMGTQKNIDKFEEYRKEHEEDFTDVNIQIHVVPELYMEQLPSKDVLIVLPQQEFKPQPIIFYER